MRGALTLLLVAVLGLAGAAASSSGAQAPLRARAQAALTGGDVAARGSVSALETARDRSRTRVSVAGVRIAQGETIARAAPGPTGFATAGARGVDLLDGRVLAYAVRRTAVLDARGARASGRVSGLRIDGRFVGDVRHPREFAIDGGRVIVNRGSTALRVVLDAKEAPLADIRIGIASAQPERDAEPARTPAPSPARTPTPAPTPTATATPRPPDRRALARRRAAAARKRLTRRGYVFPIRGPARTADNFGAVRAAPVVKHEGADIFAAFGSPVVAVRAGRLSHVGTLPIAGNRLWLTTDEGDAFFYAHLSTFSTVAKDGARVRAGQLLGYVGNTGDAEPTPPHVHFEVHPGGESKPAVDPYPIVTAWQEHQTRTSAAERSGALVTVRDFIAE